MTPTSTAINSLFLKNPVAPLANAAHLIVHLPCRTRMPRSFAFKTASDGGRVRSFDVYGSELVEKHQVSEDDDEEVSVEDDDGVEEEGMDMVDWENRIFADTLPLVGLVRMILHSEKYKIGDRISPEHESTIVEKLLPHHPSYEEKVGCGINYIMLGNHPVYQRSRCLFIVRNDGELVDFSYWKCIKGLIRKKYPRYADTFMLRHFQHRQRNT